MTISEKECKEAEKFIDRNPKLFEVMQLTLLLEVGPLKKEELFNLEFIIALSIKRFLEAFKVGKL